MKKNENGSIVLVLIIAVVLLGVGAAGYFVYKSKSDSPKSTASSSNAPKCDTDKCFQEKFVKCEPASLQQEAVFSGGSKAYYEIVGGDTANCKMLYRTDKDNLDMICTYQDTSSYNTGEDAEFVMAAAKNETDIAFGKETNCTGPKVEKLKQKKPVTNSN